MATKWIAIWLKLGVGALVLTAGQVSAGELPSFLRNGPPQVVVDAERAVGFQCNMLVTEDS